MKEEKVVDTKVIIDKIHKQVEKAGWYEPLRWWWISKELEDIINELKKKVEHGDRWVPSIGKVFRPLSEVPYHKVKAVMLIDEACPFLHNSGVPCHIDKEIKDDKEIQRKGSPTAMGMLWSLDIPQEERIPDMSTWWKQGVLMVSLAPTCKMDGIGHYKLWQSYILRLIEQINKMEDVPVLLIGKKAIEYENHLDSPHVRCITSYPWNDKDWYTWVNEILKQQDKKEIQWI